MKIKITTIIGLLVMALDCQAETVLRELSWADIASGGGSLPGEVQTDAGQSVEEYIRLANTTDEKKTLSLLTIDEPGIKENHYVITGQVRYEGIEGTAFLETMNHFGADQAYFSRTVMDSGPMQSLSGSSDWRNFQIPFFINEGNERPTKIDFNLTMPGKGTVDISSLRLVEGNIKMDLPPRVSGEWWDDRTAGIIGGSMGVIGGLLGALLGIGGSLIGRGKGRTFSWAILIIFISVGLFEVLFGLVALVLGQPAHVYSPALWCGGLFLVLGISLVGVIRKRMEQMELHRMRAMDVG